MMENLKYRLLSGWSFIRLIRLGLAGIILYQSWIASDWMIGILGALLFLQAAFNYGCCSTTSCNTYNKTDAPDNKEEVVFEEVK